MGNIKVIKACGGIEGLCLIEPEVREDERGCFSETYNKRDLEAAGIICDFVQDNQSSSVRGVIRGLHFQIRHPQTKLVRVIHGEVYDVAVDLRKGSETFGRYFGCILSETNKKQLFVPAGFAHGFMVLSEYAEFCYKVSDFYHPGDEGGIRFDDPDLDIAWPYGNGITEEQIILSDKDKKNQGFRDYCAERSISFVTEERQ